MASVITHPAIPLAIAAALGTTRVPPRPIAVACVASALPDIDALGFEAGIPYGHLLGHRGLTHSFFFALMAALLTAVFSKALRAAPLGAAILVFVATASHGLIDACTTGGLGVAFFAPFTNHRYFLPWRVIKVSPIGVAPFFSEWGRRVLTSELKWVWAPSALSGGVGFLIRKAVGGA